MTKISVIIPTYNSAKYIKDTIESVLNQTYKDLEIIVVDDGSTDNTKDIVSKYQVKYIYQENKGPAAARNRGIKEAQGEYIAFLDSDDVWMVEKLEKQMAIFENSTYAMIYCDMSHKVNEKIVHKSYLKEKGYRGPGSGDIHERLLKENFIFTPTVLVKKEVLKKTGYFDESYKICEDYKMWLTIAKKYQIAFLDEVLVIRTRNSLNITKDEYLFITSGIRLFEELMNSNGYDNETNKIIQDEYYKRFFELGYYYWNKGNMILARKNFFKASKCKSNSFKSLFYIITSSMPVSFVRMLRGFKNEVV